MKFTEKHRWQLQYLFKHMHAWSYDWDMLWEVALDFSDNDIAKAMEFLDGGVTPREAVSLNSALRKAGYNHTIRSYKEVE